MEEKLKEILNDCEDNIKHWQPQLEKLAAKMDFCKVNNFEKEFELVNIEYQVQKNYINRWREMHIEIKDVLNGWL